MSKISKSVSKVTQCVGIDAFMLSLNKSPNIARIPICLGTNLMIYSVITDGLWFLKQTQECSSKPMSIWPWPSSIHTSNFTFWSEVTLTSLWPSSFECTLPILSLPKSPHMRPICFIVCHLFMPHDPHGPFFN